MRRHLGADLSSSRSSSGSSLSTREPGPATIPGTDFAGPPSPPPVECSHGFRNLRRRPVNAAVGFVGRQAKLGSCGHPPRSPKSPRGDRPMRLPTPAEGRQVGDPFERFVEKRDPVPSPQSLQRVVDRRDRELLEVELSADPIAQLLVLVVLQITDRFEEVGVAPRARTARGRPGTGPDGAPVSRTEARGKWERASVVVRLVDSADERREEGPNDLRSLPANALARSSMWPHPPHGGNPIDVRSWLDLRRGDRGNWIPEEEDRK
jgi:hypothetical protein